MAHNINYSNGKHAFFSLKEKAWHGLGSVVQDAPTSEEAIKLAGLDYNVVKVPIYADFREISESKKGELVPNYFATVREDNLTVLGLVGNKYEIVQNTQAFNFIDEVVGSKEAIFETAGALGKGEKIFVTAKLPSNIRVSKTDDIIENYIIFSSTHDGSGSIIAGFTPVRIVCNNTLNMALSNMSNKITLRHTKNVHDKLVMGRELLGLYKAYSMEFQDVLTHLSTIPVTDEIVESTINKLILTPSEIKELAILGWESDKISTRKRNMVEDLNVYVDQGVGQELHKNSALWLFNGISSYYNNGKTYKSQEDRFESLNDGFGYKQTQKMFNLVKELI